jgi:hypothetical protein
MFTNNIIQYVKSFARKGKLPSVTASLRTYYEPYMSQAYQWASESVEGVSRYGSAFFERDFRVNVAGKFAFNKRGLIYVERSIDFDYDSDIGKLNYSSIGECWSWKKLNSSSYCADFSLLSNSIVNVTLCGYVHPDSIDWTETIYLNSYDMKNETEIRMNDNALVEISYIKISNKKYSLGGSFLINASADKYKK